MYSALKHAHLTFAILSLVLTLAWTLAAWTAPQRSSEARRSKIGALYIALRAGGGLAGLSGLLVTFVGPWHTMVFPYLGLAAFIAHGYAAAASKRELGTGRDARRRAALALQLLAIAAAWAVMNAKAF